MNTWWSLLAIYITDILLRKGENLTQATRENLIQVQVQEGHYQCRIRQQECKHRYITTYDPTELKRIKRVTNHDVRYKQLPCGTVRSICKPKFNRRKRGSRGGQSKKVTRKSPNQQVLYWRIYGYYHVYQTKELNIKVTYQ